MEKLHQRTLTQNRVFLCENLDLDEIRDELMREEVMTVGEWERIDAKVTKKDKVRYFLDTYPRCGPEAFGVLEAILNDIPERRYITKQLDATRQRLLVEGESLTNIGFRPNSKDIYPIGLMRVLVVNYDFKGRGDERKGCEKDVEKIRETFKDFDIDITTLTNLEKEKLETEIDIFVRDEKTEKAASCVFVLSSHGGENGVIKCNKGYLSRNSLIKQFGRENAPFLNAKPKLMMFQCCRGVDADDGKTPRQLTKTPVQASDTHNPTEACHNNADMLVVSASSEREVALRGELQGSLMIQRFCDMVESSWKNEHVADIFTKVTNILGEGFDLKDGRKVIPQVVAENALRRKWYLRKK